MSSQPYDGGQVARTEIPELEPDPERRLGALILATDFGERLAPISSHTPAALIRVGRHPVATHLLDILHEADAAMPIIVVINGQHPEAWDRWDTEHGHRCTIVTTGIVRPENRLGHVADLQFGLAVLPPVERVVVLSGDNLIRERLAPHIAAADATEAPVVLCQNLGPNVPAGRFAEVTTDALGRVVGFRDKPKDPQSPLAATTSYVLPALELGSLIGEFLAYRDPSSMGEFVGWLARRQTVFARTLTGEFFAIDSHAALREARAALN